MKTRTQKLDEAYESVKVRDAVLSGIAGILLSGIVGFGLGQNLSQPNVLTKKDVNQDGRLDYVVNGSYTFIENGEEAFQPIPEEGIRGKVSAEKYRVVYDRTFNPEYIQK